MLAAAGVADRYEIVGGDVFEGVPADADCYALANVLHDSDDATTIRILSECRTGVAGGGRVLIAERLIPDSEIIGTATMASGVNQVAGAAD